MSLYDKFVENKRLRRFILLVAVIGLFYLFKSMMSMFLLTFIFTFLSVQLVRTIQKKAPKIKPVWIIAPTYLIIIALLVFVIANYVPQLVSQTVKMFTSLQSFYESEDVRSNPYLNIIYNYLQQINLDNQIKVAVTSVVNYISSVGAVGFNIVI